MPPMRRSRSRDNSPTSGEARPGPVATVGLSNAKGMTDKMMRSLNIMGFVFSAVALSGIFSLGACSSGSSLAGGTAASGAMGGAGGTGGNSTANSSATGGKVSSSTSSSGGSATNSGVAAGGSLASGGSLGRSTVGGSTGSIASGGGTAGSNTGGRGPMAGLIPIVSSTGVDAPYQLGTNSYGITGGAFFAKSAKGSETVALDKTQVGKVCLKGTVDIVPTPADGSHPPYSEYWGIDLGFNLNQNADADAGADVKTPWMVPAQVVGFWFKVEGATIPPIRFKTTPTGRDPAMEQDSCASLTPVSGEVNQVFFSDMYVQCWDGPMGTGTTDISKGLVDFGLQVAGGTDKALPVDFCLTEFGVITK